MTTLDEMVDEIVDQLQGFTSSPDQVTELTQDVAVDDLTINVSDPAALSRGFIEVGDEIMWVNTVDPTNGLVNLASFGRGFRGTTASAHGAGVAVYYAPTWTRNSIKREINAQLAAVYPILYAVKAAPTITSDGGITYQFNLPSDAERVVDVRYLFTDVDGWQRAKGWEADHTAPAAFAGGRYVSIYESIPPGATIQVLYACRPARLTAGTDVFATVTGLDEACRDIIGLGVMAKLARFMDTARLANQNVQADELDQPRGIGTATAVANDLFRQYQFRLQTEQAALSTRYPARFHKVR